MLQPNVMIAFGNKPSEFDEDVFARVVKHLSPPWLLKENRKNNRIQKTKIFLLSLLKKIWKM